MPDEGVLFEGLRLGSAQAFADLLQAYEPTMRRLARLYVPEEQVSALVRHTWSTALPGLDMFTWHTTLRAWVTGICVTYGRAGQISPPAAAPLPVGVQRRRVPSVDGGPSGPAAPVPLPLPLPLPWRSLGWSSLWGPDSWAVLEAALQAQPLDVRELLWLHDVEAWPWRETLDALGLTAAQGEDLLLWGRSALATVVVQHVGADPDNAGDQRERSDGVAALLAALRPVHPGRSPDPELQRMFTAWRRRRGVRPWRRWRWELTRSAARRSDHERSPS